MTTTNIRRLPLSRLAPADYNPRSITEDALEGLGNSIKRFGMVELIVWNERTGSIVSGHQRLKALLEQGETETDVVVVDLDLVNEKALNIAMNNPAIAGDFTTDLQGMLLELHQIDAALYDELMFEELVDHHQKNEPDAEPDAMPSEKPPPNARAGDLWLLGKHRVVCGSSDDPAVHKRLMAGATAAMLATDPPYGVDYVAISAEARNNQKKGGWDNIANDDLDDASLHRLLLAALRAPGAHTAFIWHPDKRRDVFLRVMQETDWDWRQTIIWVKNALVFGRADYQWRHEPALYCKRPGGPPQTDRTETTVWEIDKISGAQHPTQKPVEIFARAIRNHTKVGDIIFDPFLGSGSCLIAAEQENRVCYGIELAPQYVDVQVSRWETFTGQKARVERDDEPNKND